MENGKLHLLVVEDDEDDFILLRHLLLKSLHEVAVERAATAEQALAGAGSKAYDVCFFDYRLGADSGLDLLQEFKRRQIVAPVIFLTGQGDEEVAVQAMKAGAVDYMLKSRLSEPSLLHAVRYALNLHKKEELLEQAQKELHASEERYRHLVETAEEGIWLTDAEGRTTFVNAKAAKMFGYTVSEMMGVSLRDLVPEECWPSLAAAWERRRLGVSEQYDFKFRRKDGSELWAIVSASPAYDRNGCFAGVLKMLTDITERKQAEEALRRSRDEWEITFNSMSEAVSFHDANFRIVRTNEAFRRLTAGKAGNTCMELVHGAHVPPEHCPMARVRSTKKTESGDFFEPHLNKMLAVRVDPVLDSKGEVASVVHVIQDITERYALQEQLQQAHKMEAVGQLAGGIAHDFNNLLMVITSYSELLLDGLQDPRLRHDADEILKAGRRAASLTQQLLAFSRKQVLSPRVLDLNATLADITKLLPRLLGEDIAVVFAPGAQVWPVKADPVQVEQVMMNLAANARDAMPKGGKLIVETSNVVLDAAYVHRHAVAIPGEFVLLTVSDTGLGMDPETQAHAFEPFFTTKAKGKGTGLGLPSVYGIVKQSGGFIWLYSELGQGTTFKIYLPRALKAGEKLAESGGEPTELRGSETILLVEDEDAVRRATHDFLELCGYTVLQARSGNEALGVAQRFAGSIDLLVTDVVLPGMSGRELCDRLLEARPALKVLFVSGYTEQVVLQRGVLQAGCMSFLQKPFPLATLARRLRELLKAETAAAAAGQ